MPLSPPPGAASAAKKIPGIRHPEVLEVAGDAMDVDNEYGVEDFIAKIEKVDDDPNTNEDNECEFPGFHQTAHTTGMSGEERGDEEDGPLYKMDALTSEADALTSSPFKLSGNSTSSEEDVNETPIARKIAERKGKAKEVARVVGKGKQGVRGKIADQKVKQSKKTREILLQETITRASRDHVDSDSAVSDGHGKFMVNSKATSEYVISLTFTMTSLLTLNHTTLFFYTLSLSSQHHTTSVEHWQSAVDMNIHPGSNATHLAPPAPSLTHASTCSSATSSSKH